jgi:hypothetical protein
MIGSCAVSQHNTQKAFGGCSLCRLAPYVALRGAYCPRLLCALLKKQMYATTVAACAQLCSQEPHPTPLP